MKASTVNKLNNLLNIGIPASKQEDRSHHGIVEYIDPTHVTLRAAKDCPLYIQGTLEDRIIEAVIAPRIEQEED